METLLPVSGPTRRYTVAKALMLCALVSTVSYLQGQSLLTQYSQIDPQATLRIQTKYTDIDLQTWDSAGIAIDAHIETQILSEDKDFPVASYAKLQVKTTESQIDIRTDFSSITVWRSSLNRIEWELEDGQHVHLKNFRIKLSIKAPASIQLSLRNAYGQVNLPTLTSGADISLRHGKLYAKGLGPHSQLELSYVKGKLGILSDALLNLSHTQYEIQTAHSLAVKGKFSHLNVETLEHLESESKYFSYAIGSLNTLQGVDRNINISIGTLQYSADWELSFSNVAIKALAPSFQALSLNSDHTHVELSTHLLEQYRLQLSNSHGSLRFPSNAQIQEDVIQASSRKVTASLGKNPKATLEIKTNYGDVVIK